MVMIASRTMQLGRVVAEPTPKPFGADEPEPWEEPFEGRLGEVTLVEMGSLAEDEDAAHFLCRYMALRLASEVLDGVFAAERITAEVRLVRDYLPPDRGPAWSRESRPAAVGIQQWQRIRQLLEAIAPIPTRELAIAAVATAVDAVGQGHSATAHQAFRLAWRAALEGDFPLEAARAARGIAALAAAGGGRRSVRRWERYAKVMERRVARRGA